MTLTRHSPSDPRSERVTHSVTHVSLTVPSVVSDTEGVYKTPVTVTPTVTPFDPSSMIRCRDYHAHQSSHHRDGIGWTCGICQVSA